MYEHLLLSPATIFRNKRLLISHYWRVRDPKEYGKEVEVVTVPSQTEVATEPEMGECYFEDKEGNRIPEHQVRPGMQVTFVLNSANSKGKTVIIDLSSTRKDFKYKDKPLEEDQLEYRIKKPQERIPLEVIAQQ